jgi:hypothetical protein
MTLRLSRLVAANGGHAAVAAQPNVASQAGSSNGASVTIPLTFVDKYGNGSLPVAGYSVAITPSQPCFASVTNKSSSGFSVVLTPPTGSITLASGTFDVTVIG